MLNVLAMLEIGHHLAVAVVLIAVAAAVAYALPPALREKAKADHQWRLDHAPQRSATADVVYVIEATASEALAQRGPLASCQPVEMRFGPFEQYVELVYGTLRCGPGGEGIGSFDRDNDVWRVDDLVFSDLVICAKPRAEVDASALRYPTVRY